MTDPSNNHTVTEYDAAGRQTEVTDGDGNITAYTYNAAGRLTKVIRKDHKPGAGTADSDYLWYVVSYTYDTEGRITKVTDEGEDTDRNGDGDGKESCKVRIRSSSARALMNAEYEGAVDAVLASRGAIDALGDEFPRMMLRYAEDLPEDKQKFLLEEFLHRVSERPSLEAARDWLRMVSMIFIQDERLTPILFKTWQEMPKGTDWFSDRLALLDAMATHPDPSFKPVFEHAAKSRDDEIKAIGRTGLHVLAEVAAGRWPFEKPTKGQ